MRLDLVYISNCLFVLCVHLLLLFSIFQFAAHFYFHLRKTGKTLTCCPSVLSPPSVNAPTICILNMMME